MKPLQWFRKNKDKENELNSHPNTLRIEPENKTSSLIERPRICSIDVDKSIVESLVKKGYNFFEGSLGNLLNVPNNKQNKITICQPDYNFPANLHEFDIVIIDLQNSQRNDYNFEKLKRRDLKGGDIKIVFLSHYPETVFDPRGDSADNLKDKLKPLLDKKSIIIVFASEDEVINYDIHEETPKGYRDLGSYSRSIYSFYDNFPDNNNLTGKDTEVIFPANSELRSLLERHNKEAVYSITFSHPTRYDSEKETRIKDENFIPLMIGKPDKIIAYVEVRNENFTFVFPHIRQKELFLSDLLEKVLPEITPEIFPFSTQFAWIEFPEYRLPNEVDFQIEMKLVQEEFKEKLASIQEKINLNRKEFGYLHDMLKLSGIELVKKAEEYLKYLGFDNVINVDELIPDLKEEDLRIENEKGLLVIEVKGIGGTSTDGECSQISKIRFRRIKERRTPDVTALYLVNHQRYLPPESRNNPPFSSIQIQDALDDQRGLLTTYDLFKLYFNIQSGFITKEDARDSLYQKGLVIFQPRKKNFEVPVLEVYHNGTVAICNIDNFNVVVGLQVTLQDQDKYRKCEIIEIKVNGKSVNHVDSGEVGLKLSEPVKKESIIWIPKD